MCCSPRRKKPVEQVGREREMRFSFCLSFMRKFILLYLHYIFPTFVCWHPVSFFLLPSIIAFFLSISRLSVELNEPNRVASCRVVNVSMCPVPAPTLLVLLNHPNNAHTECQIQQHFPYRVPMLDNGRKLPTIFVTHCFASHSDNQK